MENDIKLKHIEAIQNLIGILFIIPVYFILGLLNYTEKNHFLLFFFLMFLPSIIGIILSCIFFRNKISNINTVCVSVVLCLVVYYYYKSIHNVGWTSFGYFIYFLLTTAAYKLLLCIFWGKIAGWKKSVVFSLIYALPIIWTLFILNF